LRRRSTTATPETGQSEPLARLVSLDAYRGFIMIMLAASGFGIASLSRLPEDAPVWQTLDYQIWQEIGFYFQHPDWQSNFALPGQESPLLAIGISFWDLIQPAFMFMVGVAMPYSYARRAMFGHSGWRRAAHAAWRALVLVLLGVYLSSIGKSQTNWTFVNVLCQIGLGYLFVYALLGRKLWIQMLALVVILVGHWGLFYSYTPPQEDETATVVADEETVFEGRFAPWSKQANVGHAVDVWLLNQFPRADEFEYNSGGYVTLNFVPSIATMLLGVFCGQLLRSGARWWQKLLLLVFGGALCMALGMVAAQYACPIVKRIWTPSWVLFSGGWVIWMLAAFYLVFDLCRLRWLAIPLVIVGMNSIVMYLMGQMLRPWAIGTIKTHFLGLLQHIEIWTSTMFLADDLFGRVIWPTSAFLVFWLIALWMYRQKYFVRI
jgi:predicted acyltransferase